MVPVRALGEENYFADTAIPDDQAYPVGETQGFHGDTTVGTVVLDGVVHQVGD